MKVTKEFEVTPEKAFRTLGFIGAISSVKDPNRATFAFGCTHKSHSDIRALAKHLPLQIEILFAERVKYYWLERLLPSLVPIQFGIRIKDPSCILEVANRLDLFLLIQIHNVDAGLVNDFVAVMKKNLSPEKILESDGSSLAYVVNFDYDGSDVYIKEYWTFDASLSNELALYV